ncbi:MAG: peptidoglycan bridge formation glycyltransferase FemA/FemB family protein [Bacilli bacterium]|jgi:lipid II:glycine glycyltransferase (peptidoglycan interpeptide bridge formation enzyme)
MQIIELTKEQFDKFAVNHKNRNFNQTSQYGSLMNRHGFIDIYVGLLDDNNNLIGGSLILGQKKFGRYKIGYAPRGFLIDFNDSIIVENFTKLLSEYLFRLGYIYVKIDPRIIHIERDQAGNPVIGGINNDDIISHLKKLNYVHKGFNLNFETLKPRWNAITKLSASSDRLFTLFKKQVRNKIRKSFKRGITIYKGTPEDLKLFYSLIDKRRSQKLNYYLDMYELFSKDNMLDIYFAKLDPAIYTKSSKELYENELKYNSEITELIQNSMQDKSKNSYISIKMESDQLLGIYKKDLINANNMYRAYPNGIVIATSAIVKYGNEIFFLIDGYNDKFKPFCANYLMKWAIINEYARKGFLYINHNGITGNFNKEDPFYGLYQFKKGFNSDVIEYIGEFDLIVNKNIYHAYQQLAILKKFFVFKK